MENSSAPDEEAALPDSDLSVQSSDESDAVAATESSGETAGPERPVSTTIGTGSFFGIGCTIFALLFVCVGVAIFMWRQVN